MYSTNMYMYKVHVQCTMYMYMYIQVHVHVHVHILNMKLQVTDCYSYSKYLLPILHLKHYITMIILHQEIRSLLDHHHEYSTCTFRRYTYTCT